MKKLVISATIIVLALVLAIPVRVYGYFQGCIKTSEIADCLEPIPKVLSDAKRLEKWVKLPALRDIISILEKVEPFVKQREYLLGESQKTIYTILLLNDQELRTNGGFMGSYAVINVEDGDYNVRFQDIYVPDGQITGYIAPPEPLQRAFQTGSHRLPNADWSPDFPRSAEAIRWFFDKGGESNPDVLITINLSTVVDIMRIVGDVEIPEYGERISSDNLYNWLQSNTEVDFFPGSTQKRDVITATGKSVLEKLKGLPWSDKVRVAKLLLDDLDEKNILINSNNVAVQKLLVKNEWAGVYAPDICEDENCQVITVGLVEMNLGSNKANCCVSRKVKHKITAANGKIIHLIELEITNDSMYEEPMKPVFYGGNYLSYLRFYLPDGADNIQVSALPTLTERLGIWPMPYQGDNESFAIEKVYGFTELGLFHTTKAGTSSQVRVSYEIPDTGKDIEFGILKQRGLRRLPTEVSVLDGEYVSDLENDYHLLVRRK